ncbi:MAG: VCBS repeat-containing protein, partial [Ekhidna sp.]|nr:VCBS repeat-containing protein [Ekhidna sp.]
FADVDGENGPDVLITGENNTSERIANLYLNDGEGNFMEKSGTPFAGVYFSSIAFADVDGENGPDVLITGQANVKRIANLYVNDGSGNFMEKSGTPFTRGSAGSIAFADVNRDGNEDVLITGGGSSSGRIARLYLNDGEGNFMEKSGTPFAGVINSSVAFADVDGDDDSDVLITGWTGSKRIAKLYINDQAPVFSSGSSASVPENATEVLTVNADEDSETITYSVSGGADRSLFSISRNSGALTFNTAPDFEAMSSDAGNNTYVVEVTASDGVNEGVSQTITVTVTDENEAPAFDTPSGTTWFYVEENAEDANV